jgi:hypothetical protein
VKRKKRQDLERKKKGGLFLMAMHRKTSISPGAVKYGSGLNH